MNPMDAPLPRALTPAPVPRTTSGPDTSGRPVASFAAEDGLRWGSGLTEEEVLDVPEPVALNLQQSCVVAVNEPPVNVITATPPPVRRERGPAAGSPDPSVNLPPVITDRPPPVRNRAPTPYPVTRTASPSSDRNIPNRQDSGPRLNLGEIKDLLGAPESTDELEIDPLFERWSTMEPTVTREEAPVRRAGFVLPLVLAGAGLFLLVGVPGLIWAGSLLSMSEGVSPERAVEAPVVAVPEEAPEALGSTEEASAGVSEEAPQSAPSEPAPSDPAPTEVLRAAPTTPPTSAKTERRAKPTKAPEKPAAPIASAKPAAPIAPADRGGVAEEAPAPTPTAAAASPEPAASSPQPAGWAEVLAEPEPEPEAAPAAPTVDGDTIVWAPWGTDPVDGQ